MNEKIIELIDSRFVENGDYVTKYDKNGICIEDAVEELFAADPSIEQYSVTLDHLFDSPGCDIYSLSIAYVYEGKLEHETHCVEVY